MEGQVKMNDSAVYHVHLGKLDETNLTEICQFTILYCILFSEAVQEQLIG